MYNYDDNGALSITHFAPDTVTAACGAYILGRPSRLDRGSTISRRLPALYASSPEWGPERKPGRQRPPCLPLPRHRRRLPLLQPGLCQGQARNGR